MSHDPSRARIEKEIRETVSESLMAAKLALNEAKGDRILAIQKLSNAFQRSEHASFRTLAWVAAVLTTHNYENELMLFGDPTGESDGSA